MLENLLNLENIRKSKKYFGTLVVSLEIATTKMKMLEKLVNLENAKKSIKCLWFDLKSRICFTKSRKC